MASDVFDDTNPHIVLAETRAKARELARDVAQHDGKIETLQGQVTRLDERVLVLNRFLWLLLTGVGGLVVDAVIRHLR